MRNYQVVSAGSIPLIMRRLLFVVQLPGGGSTISTINAAEVQQVAADGLPSQWHRQRTTFS